MPSITLSFDNTNAARIQAALASTPYPQTAAGYKAMLVDYTDSFVKEYEAAQAEKAALAAIAAPSDLTLT